MYLFTRNAPNIIPRILTLKLLYILWANIIITFSVFCVKCNLQNMFVGRQPATLKSMAEIEENNKNSAYLFLEDVCWESIKNRKVNER